jgi:peptidoglycan/LPS O-acetylase OafA/YrhL
LLLGQAWTLCYEEQFYAVTGLILLCCPKRYFSAAIGVTLGVAITWLQGRRSAWPIDGYFFDGAWFQFALGILLYHAITSGRRGARSVAAAVFLATTVSAASFGRSLLEPDKNGPQVYLCAGLFALAALGLFPLDRNVIGSRIGGWLRPIGLMCYSLYLVHVPVVDLIRAGLEAAGVATDHLSPFVSLPLCAIPSLVIAWAFHRTVEVRFMRSPDPQRLAGISPSGPVGRQVVSG